MNIKNKLLLEYCKNCDINNIKKFLSTCKNYDFMKEHDENGNTCLHLLSLLLKEKLKIITNKNDNDNECNKYLNIIEIIIFHNSSSEFIHIKNNNGYTALSEYYRTNIYLSNIKYNLSYYSFPKTGKTTIENVLKLRRHYIKIPNNYNFYNVITIRNPFDKLLSSFIYSKNFLLEEKFNKSSYLHYLKIQHNNYDKFILRIDPTSYYLKKYIFNNSNIEECFKNLLNHLTIENSCLIKNNLFRSQYDQIHDYKLNIVDIDYVILFDNFNNDLQFLLNKLNFKTKIQHLNKTGERLSSKNKDFAKNARLLDISKYKHIIENIYKKDMKLYNHIKNNNKNFKNFS